MEEVTLLNQMLLFARVLSLTEEDRLVWNADPSGMFSVKYANEWLTLSYGPMVKLPDLIWKNISAPKMQFISWLAWKVKLKTFAFLQNIGVLDQNGCTLCIFCRSEIETGDDVLLHCGFVWKIWSEILLWCGVQWVLPGSIIILLNWWDGVKFKGMEKLIWEAVPSTIMRNVWKARNACKFEGKNVNWESLSESVKVNIALWVKFNLKGLAYSVNDSLQIGVHKGLLSL